MSEESRAQENQRAVNLYHRVFGTKDGAAVLSHIEKVFGLRMPAFIPQARGRHCEYDQTHAAIRDGQRQILLHINAQLDVTPQGDGNIDRKKPKVKRD